MALIEVGEREKIKDECKKTVPLDAEVFAAVESYRKFLVVTQKADPKKFSVRRIVNDVVRAAMRCDKDYQKWVGEENVSPIVRERKTA
jgi:hypothetical protein